MLRWVRAVSLSSCTSHHFAVCPVPFLEAAYSGGDPLSEFHYFCILLIQACRSNHWLFSFNLFSGLQSVKSFIRELWMSLIQVWGDEIVIYQMSGTFPGRRCVRSLQTSFHTCCPVEHQGKEVLAQAKKNRWNWEMVPTGIPVTCVWPWAIDQCFKHLVLVVWVKICVFT